MLIKSENGSTLVLTLVVLVVIGLAASSTYLSVTSSYRSAQTKLASTKALYAAESGINDALWHLNLNGKSRDENGQPVSPDWESVGGEDTLELAAEDGSYIVTVTKKGSRYEIVSTGFHGTISRAVSLTIELPPIVSEPVTYARQIELGSGQDSIKFYDQDGGEMEREEAIRQVEPLPEVLVNLDIDSIDFAEGQLRITDSLTQDIIAAETIEIGKEKGNNKDLVVTGTVIAQGDITINDEVKVVGDIISLHGSVKLGHFSEIEGAVVSLENDVQYDPEGKGNAYGQSNLTIRGLVYAGNAAIFGNHAEIHGALMAENVTFHNKNEIYYEPEYLLWTTVQFSEAGSAIREWKLL
ncbi:MAG: hypothetical protein H0Z38_04865 [Firmicutes bacterium]|nr:hypothetical protein [Bacillota bacterium]